MGARSEIRGNSPIWSSPPNFYKLYLSVQMELDDVLGHLITLNDMNNPKNNVLGQTSKSKNPSAQKNFIFVKFDTL